VAEIVAFVQQPVRVVFLEEDEGENFALLSPIAFEVGVVSGIVEARFRTDAASIPWWGRWAVDKWGKHARACIVHDWLYTKHPNNIDRKTADWVLRVLLRSACGVGVIKAWLLWACVRLGGKHAFNNPKPNHMWQGEL
jgi:hypothetical protein